MFELNVRTVTSGRRGPELEHQARALLEKLYALLLRPVEDLIAPYRRLVVIPHGVLHGVPFAALHDGARYLIERVELALSPSATAMTFCRRKRVNAVADRTVVVAHSADGRLPGALAEGEAIADLFGATRLFEADARVQNVREQVNGAAVLHVAAHGQSRRDAPLFSHLRLDDGQLTALDCLDLSLDCELVTLSACETSHAVVAAGDEPIGLTRSLLYAGARSVIQSLWRVDDRATLQLMSDLYRYLRNGAGRAEALRQAQLACLRQSSTSGSGHPAFWAAFGLVGDWRPLQYRHD
jgi:CHAT domain-containing protein